MPLPRTELTEEQRAALSNMKLHTGITIPLELLQRLQPIEAIAYQYMLDQAREKNDGGWVPITFEDLCSVFPKDTQSILGAINELIDGGFIQRKVILTRMEEHEPLTDCDCYRVLKFIAPSGWKGLGDE